MFQYLKKMSYFRQFSEIHFTAFGRLPVSVKFLCIVMNCKSLPYGFTQSLSYLKLFKCSVVIIIIIINFLLLSFL